MTTHTHDLPLALWQNNLEELDGEIARLAVLCQVAILDPGRSSACCITTPRWAGPTIPPPSPSCARCWMHRDPPGVVDLGRAATAGDRGLCRSNGSSSAFGDSATEADARVASRPRWTPH